MGDPGLLRELVLELALGPSRITDEGADLEALHLVHHGLLRGEVGGILEPSVLLGPAEAEKVRCSVLTGPPMKDGGVPDRAPDLAGEDVLAEEVADLLADGPVEDVAEGPGRAAVLREEEDAAEKGRFAQARIGQDQAALVGLFRWTLG